jgi:hypothetical protein
MSREDKEEAKKILGFKSVPFYVVVDKNGVIVQKGSKVDFNAIPGVMEKENIITSTPFVEQKLNVVEKEAPQPAVVSPERVLTIDLDFDF